MAACRMQCCPHLECCHNSSSRADSSQQALRGSQLAGHLDCIITGDLQHQLTRSDTVNRLCQVLATTVPGCTGPTLSCCCTHRLCASHVSVPSHWLKHDGIVGTIVGTTTRPTRFAAVNPQRPAPPAHTWMTSSISFVSSTPGTKPAPMPWILWGPGLPPDSTGDSDGSTATSCSTHKTRHAGQRQMPLRTTPVVRGVWRRLPAVCSGCCCCPHRSGTHDLS